MFSIELTNLSKKYGPHQVINTLSVCIDKGTVFGLLGPNGAGKTTLMRLLTNIILPDSGQILINGERFSKKHVKQIGYMPEERGLYRNMRVKEHLLYIANLYGIQKQVAVPKIDEWMERLGVTSYSRKLVGELSKGMSQKVQFIAIVLHDPKLLVLDEPFSGLDPVSSQSLEREINRLKAEGTTIVLSTHRMEQIEHFCDKVVLIHRGTKLIEGKVNDLKNKFKEGIIRIETTEKLSDSFTDRYQVIGKTDTVLDITFATDEEKKQFLHELMEQSSLLSYNEMLPSMHSIFVTQVKSVEARTGSLSNANPLIDNRPLANSHEAN